ncbi:FAD/NAD(P)-binding protein [Kribbella sp. CA-294648]|uniref:FAD/NAD(P)-binding protein n=1 Tax=Kribbella sp. CA-294648 TaxID=3239948 RepID=UPI003D8A2E60
MDIGIIGAGAAGVSLLDALAQQVDRTKAGSIAVFEGAPSLWRGRAYQPDLDAVRVNAPPVLMSVRHQDPQHYQRWVAGRDEYLDPLLGAPIVPRAVYGDYLEATATAAIEQLREHGWRVEVVRDWATGVSPLRAAGGATYQADQVVLSVGGGRPTDHYGLAGSPGFVQDPYPLETTLAGIRTDSHVAVIGSGLTAIDIVAGLTAAGHTGPITLLSRRGVLPEVQQRPVKLDFRHLRRETLPSTFRELVSLLEAELAECGQKLTPLADEVLAREDPVERLRRQLDQVDGPHLGRRMLTAAIHMLGSTAWQRLLPGDREFLYAEHFRTINSLASPMVPLNALILLRGIDAGQVRLAGGLRSIEPAAGGFRIAGSEVLRADVVVNAVNPPVHAIPTETEKLVGSLVATDTVSLPRTGGLSPRSAHIHLLGGISAGTSFVVPSLLSVAAAADATADRLLK